MAEVSAGRVWEVKGGQGFDEKIRIPLGIPASRKYQKGRCTMAVETKPKQAGDCLKLWTNIFCSVCPPEFLWLILPAILPLCCGSCNIQACTGTTEK